MSFRKIHQLKKNVATTSAAQNIDIMVVGGDQFSLLVVDHLIKNSQASWKWIQLPNRGLTFAEQWGPAQIRGDENIGNLSKIAPSLRSEKHGSVFFKEQKFRNFDGRSRSETLLPGEKYFSLPALKGNLLDFFPILKEKMAFEDLIKMASHTTIKNIELIADGWSIETTAGEVIYCRQLIWCDDPRYFIKHISSHSSLTAQFVERCEQVDSPSALFLKWVFDNIPDNIFPSETFFIPLSLTHEWGHVIAEWSVCKKQLDLVYLFNPEEQSEDEIGKRIHLLKNNLEKAFPMISSLNYKEKIFISEFFPSDNISEALTTLPDNLIFIGPNALLRETNKSSHLVRGMLSLLSWQGKVNLP